MDMIGILDPDPHENLCGSETLKEIPPGSGSASAWTDADPDPGGKKAHKMYRFIR